MYNENILLNRAVQKKPYSDKEKAIEVMLLHFDKGKRLSGLGAEAMLHLAAYGFAAVEQRKSRNHWFLAAFWFFVADDKEPQRSVQSGNVDKVHLACFVPTNRFLYTKKQV